MHSSLINVVSLRQDHPRSTWLTLWAVLVNLLCVCKSQNELLLRTVAYPYPLSFDITQINGSSMTNVSSMTDGNFYRTLTLHDWKLFVGGKSQLFSVRTEDLSLCEIVTNDTVTTNNVNNYVTVIQPIGDNLLVCGTSSSANSGNPYCRQRSSQNMADAGSPTSQKADNYITALTRDQNTSWLLVNDTGGSVYHVYVGSELAVGEPLLVAKADIIVNSNELTVAINLTADQSRYYLDEPQFVGDPIDYNGRIYYFFRESGTEHINAGKIVFSRVARVCKSETGGPEFTPLDKNFVTFGKARLACSVAGTYKFYYNHIQDVYQSTKDTNVVYAIFTTEHKESSALCAYRLDELEELFFESQYKAPVDGEARNRWDEVPSSEEPFSREQFCPLDDTALNVARYDTATIMKIRTFPLLLLNNEVENKLHYESKGTKVSNPLLISTRARFTQIVVDNSVKTNWTDVFYIGTENGTVLKAYLNEDRSEALVVEEIRLNTDGVKPVLSMVKSDQAVFVGTDSRVYKIPFEHCCDYILRNLSDAGDPYCKMIVTGDLQLDLSTCSGDTMFDTIRILRAPSDLTLAINITDQPVRTYLTAEAVGGKNLRVVGVDCGNGSAVRYTELKSVSPDGTEFLLVNITASGSTESMNCSISVATDNGVVETRSFKLTIDNSAKANATEKDLDEIAVFDNNVASYLFRRNKWLKNVETSCMLQNVGVCTVGDTNCP